MTTRILPVLSPADQLNYLRRHGQAQLGMAMSAAVLHNQDREFVRKSCEWAINSKGLAVEALAEQALTARDTADPKTRPIADQLTAVREELASLSVETRRPYPWSKAGNRLTELRG